MRWDIFCQIVDNYGDAGVCWRLARSLTSLHGQEVRIFCEPLIYSLLGLIQKSKGGSTFSPGKLALVIAATQ